MRNPRFGPKWAGNYVDGAFRIPVERNGEILVRSPASLDDEVARVAYSYSSVASAVRSAREAFGSWRKTRAEARFELLRQYQRSLERRQEELGETIAREVGKPLWEARIEVQAMVAGVETTLREGMKLVEGFALPASEDGAGGFCDYRPLGAIAVVGPFSYAAQLPNGHLVPALATGNTVVFKPSEKAPMTAQLLAECFHEAGFPPGVFNLLQGEKEVGRRLVTHEGIAAVLFTGSHETGTRIKQDTLQQHWKLVALEMGGKNPALVWEDADLERAARSVVLGAFQSAGQSCLATSRVLVHAKLFDAFVARIHEKAKAFAIAHPFDDPFMGPLIEQGAVDRYARFVGIAAREGYEIVMRGKPLELSGLRGNYVSPSICVLRESSLEQARKSVFEQTELFAPALAVDRVESLEEAVAICNATQFGLAASVFTGSEQIFRACREDLEFGLVNWNRATTDASPRLPFGGWKKSGNHFPAALSAPLACVHPVSSLEDAMLGVPPAEPPGLNWK